LETVRRYTEVIETYVKAYPDQWMWMHERWKTRPPTV
jgi:KDO2-lipid IV(A) lauroyltransferase